MFLIRRPYSFFFILCSCLLFTCSSISLKTVTINAKELALKKPVKSDWTFIVYMAADNDLDYFARRNILEMQAIGSNNNISIVLQLDRYGAHEHTKRLYVTKEALYQMNAHDITAQQKLNSGSAQTLIDCCQWAIEEYPANHYALILWNHGTGILDSIRSKTINASELFTFNPANHMLELDRSIGFLEYIESKPEEKELRGVCFSDTYGSYLTNQKLDYALKTISKSFLGGKKFDVIAFDACLMAMVEVGNLISPYADFMIGSQEVELGTGWPYHLVLAPFIKKTLSPLNFSKHIVACYKKNYESITKDFTQSAVDLSQLNLLEKNIDIIAQLLLTALKNQKNYSVSQTISASRSKRMCTYFSEPMYVDLHHLFTNLNNAISFISLEAGNEQVVIDLKKYLQEGCALIEKIVVSNTAGSSLKKAQGLSIYFPLRHVDSSYEQIPFTQKTRWTELLQFIL